VQQRVSDTIEQKRGTRKAAFITNSALESIKTYADGAVTAARLIAIIGAVSLVVGGIGITNIMLISVTERTREIGIRLALGTYSRNILTQFLTEALALSVFGGMLGVVLGWGASWLVGHANGWPTTVTLKSVLVALTYSLGVGILFGFQPARRASQMKPIDALRGDHC
jgi:ABC-type antimicrobial peptide transport system permease subunit